MGEVTISNISVTLNEKGQRGYVVTYMVTGVTSTAAALVHPGVPQAGSAYSFNEPYCTATGIIAGPYGGQTNTTTYTVTVTYSIRPSGGQKQNPSNPLLVPTRWTFSASVKDEQFDLDKDGKPITNSARERFNQPFTRPVPLIQMTAKKWVSATNVTALLAKVIDYTGAVNNDGWKFGLKGLQAVCNGGGPVGEFYETGNTILEFGYSFQIQRDPFVLRVKDEGFKRANPDYQRASGQGYMNTSTKYIDAAANGQSLTTPFKLNGKGHLFGGPALATGQWAGEGTPANATLETTSDACFLKYKIYVERAFKGLGL